MHIIIVLKVASICFSPYVAYSNKVTMFKHFIGHRQIKPEIFWSLLLLSQSESWIRYPIENFSFVDVSYQFS